MVLSIAYGLTLLLGVPAYLLLRKNLPYTPFVLGLFGSAVAAAPVACLQVWAWAPMTIELVGMYLAIAVCGAFAGLVFWFFTKDMHGVVKESNGAQ